MDTGGFVNLVAVGHGASPPVFEYKKTLCQIFVTMEIYNKHNHFGYSGEKLYHMQSNNIAEYQLGD
ncbi:hypothetical protein [Sporomusa malonica]|uniref:hypothetical protein n=1 Tax=Sporomusa malonica TaxID=112901 RepID=UPI00111C8486